LRGHQVFGKKRTSGGKRKTTSLGRPPGEREFQKQSGVPGKKSRRMKAPEREELAPEPWSRERRALERGAKMGTKGSAK